MRSSPFFVLAGALCTLALAGCGRDEVRTYTIKKEPAGPAAPASTGPVSSAPALPGAGSTAPSASADAAMRNTAVDTASGPSRPMRKATLLIPGANGGPGAELAVTAFPGDVGGNLANVNRWRQQLGLPPIGESELGAALQHLDVGSLHVDLVELVGPAAPPASPQRVLGAIVPYAGATWFFKLTGPDALVARERDAFLAFLRSVRPQG